MKLTKYNHACFTVEQDGQILVVDPGNFSDDFTSPANVVAVVITHQHADHFSPDLLTAIYTKNPNSLLLADPSIIDAMPDHPGRAVQAGERLTIGAFDVEFFGGEHAHIHSTMPAVVNLGVMINDLLYYPGDSLTLPGRPVTTLALPAAAPWLKTGEAIDFLTAIQPRFAFPTHDAILSKAGKELSDGMLGRAAQAISADYQRLTQPIDL